MRRAKTPMDIVEQIEASERKRADEDADAAAMQEWVDGLALSGDETDGTIGRKKRALLRYDEARGRNISSACMAAGIVRATWYRWIEDDAVFSQAAEHISERHLDRLAERLHQRGEDTDTTAAIFLLKSHRREVYGDRQQVDHSGTVKHNVSIASIAGMTDEQIRAEIERRLDTQ